MKTPEELKAEFLDKWTNPFFTRNKVESDLNAIISKAQEKHDDELAYWKGVCAAKDRELKRLREYEYKMKGRRQKPLK